MPASSSLRGTAWKAPGNMWGDAGPRSAIANRGHCFLALSHLLLPASSQDGLQPASHPRGLPSSQTSHMPQVSTYHRNSCGNPCQPPRLMQGIPKARPARPGDILPCLSQPSTNAQQKPAAHSPHRHLAGLQPKKGLHSPLHFSSTLCQPSLKFGPLLGRWCSNKSKTVNSGVLVTDVQIQSSHLAMGQVVKHKALLLWAAAWIWWEGQGICQQT